MKPDRKVALHETKYDRAQREKRERQARALESLLGLRGGFLAGRSLKSGSSLDALVSRLMGGEAHTTKKTDRLDATPDDLFEMMHPEVLNPSAGTNGQKLREQEFMERQRQLTGPLETMPSRPLTVDRFGFAPPNALSTARMGKFPELDVNFSPNDTLTGGAGTNTLPGRIGVDVLSKSSTTTAPTTDARAAAEIDKSVIDTLMKEAKAGDLRDAKMIASVVANRAALTGKSWKSIVSAPKQFSAYTRKSFPPGVNQPKYRSIVEQAVDDVLANGPITKATYYATPDAVSNLPPNLEEEATTAGHVFKTDPQNRAIRTAGGFVSIDPTAAPDVRPDGQAAADSFMGGLSGIVDKVRDAIGTEPEGQKGGPSKPKAGTSELAFAHPDQTNISPSLASVIASVQIDMGRQIGITSGYRSPAHNAAVKGAKGSLHMKGMAADLDMTGMSEDERKTLVEKLSDAGVGGIITYSREPNMLHIDMRPRAPNAPPHFMFNKTAALMDNAPAWFKEVATEIAPEQMGQSVAELPDTGPVPLGRPQPLAPSPSVAEAVQPSPSVAERVQPAQAAPEKTKSALSSIAEALSPVSAAYAESAPTPERAVAQKALEHVVGRDITPPEKRSAPPPDVAELQDARPQHVSPVTPSLRVGGILPDAATEQASPLAPTDTVSPLAPTERVSPLATERVAPVEQKPEVVSPDNLPGGINDMGLNRVAALPSEAKTLSPIADYETQLGVEVPEEKPKEAPVVAPKTPIAPPAPPVRQPVAPVVAPPVQPAANASAATPAPRAPTPQDILSGVIGQATASDGNIQSRDAYGRTAVTNKYGATTVTLPDGRQAASAQKGPLTKSTISNPIDSMFDIGSSSAGKTKVSKTDHQLAGLLLGGVLGALAGGPAGAASGAAIGNRVFKPGTLIDRMFTTYPDAPSDPKGYTGGNTDRDRMRSISPDVADAIDRGDISGLF